MTNNVSEKNLLQEFCQKQKIGLPVYDSWYQGELHKIKWWANVTIRIDKKLFSEKTRTAHTTKSLAEKKAAQLMLKLLEREKIVVVKQENNSERSLIMSKNNILINFDVICLIDLENKPFFKKNYKGNYLYMGFINLIHNSFDKYNHWYKAETDDINREINTGKTNLLLYVINGGTTDLADHFMSAFIYPMVNYISTKDVRPEIFIISGDHAGWCTRICLKRVLKWKGFKVKISNLSSLDDH